MEKREKIVVVVFTLVVVLFFSLQGILSMVHINYSLKAHFYALNGKCDESIRYFKKTRIPGLIMLNFPLAESYSEGKIGIIDSCRSAWINMAQSNVTYKNYALAKRDLEKAVYYQDMAKGVLVTDSRITILSEKIQKEEKN